MHPAGLPFVGASLARRRGRPPQPLAAPRRARLPRPPTPRSSATRRGCHRPGPALVVAPADGLICLIEEAVPPAELDLPDDAAAAGQHLPVDVRRPRAARPDRR